MDSEYWKKRVEAWKSIPKGFPDPQEDQFWKPYAIPAVFYIDCYNDAVAEWFKKHCYLEETIIKALISKINDAIENIDCEYPRHYDELDPFIALLEARLEGDERDDLTILMEVKNV